MDGAPGQAQAPAQPRPANHPLQNLIRPEQVQRLPHLNPQQKSQTEQRVKTYWEYINNNQHNQNDPGYVKASQDLAKLSNTLMQGMKAFNQQRAAAAQRERAAQQMASQQANAQPNVQPTPNQQSQNQPQPNGQPQAQSQSSSGSVTFSQLLPDVQARVNTQQFFYPPAMTEGTRPAEQWLQEAKARFGQAIQRAQMAKSKRNELQRAANARTQGGNPLTPEETTGLQAKLQQCDKAIRESQNFMEKFKEQQEQFRSARPQQQQQRYPQPGGPSQAVNENAGASENQPQGAQMQQNAQGPQAHSIATAQAAARANAASAGSAPVQGTPQSAGVTTGPQQTPIDQAQIQTPFNASSAMMSQPSQSRPNTAAGPQSAVHPSANIQASHAHPQSAVNTHPLNPINGMKTNPPSIPKNLQIPDPTPVQMPPARPTLNGGANVGFSGQLAQPAITTFPGYVLEHSEDGHLLSKKKLNDLVREVLGPNSEDQLTAEAEEICLGLVDDFIDDLLVSSCRLAKLRGAQSLEAKDVQVILERQYNIRVPGFSTDEIRTVRKNQPAAGWAHKVGAVQAAKLMNGSGSGAAVASGGAGAGTANGGS
ncbi:Transcription initiation factor TFIID subunit 12 [Knufia obscura]|uniref:Transcription initiation factor TFIID subunit 12 n=2 Tax=Knufia TaxID=430999 RepID=A0AAN8IAW5_9EURO|nr:Transcription initiation factor TFIID subunit 12 [Knufia obscura]KAK5957276.1 Transcription initiation factor TFIID subunit 12 [Knufia fluminis]